MDNNGNRSGNNFFSGFLLGALIGAAVVFLLGTKKGKKILKAISEEGEGKILNILNKLGKSVDIEDVVAEDDEIEKNVQKKEIAKKIIVEDRPKTARRFFKGISRHLN